MIELGLKLEPGLGLGAWGPELLKNSWFCELFCVPECGFVEKQYVLSFLVPLMSELLKEQLVL